MRKKPIILPPDPHILIIKLAGIGDLLFTTPALRALRARYPQARIDLLSTPAPAGLLKGWDVIDNIMVLDKYLFDYPKQMLTNPRNLLRLRPLWQQLHGGHYDAVILTHHLTLPFGRLKHQLLMRATGAKWRVGLDTGHGWFLKVKVKDEGFGAMHEVEYNLELARALDATTDDTHLTIPLTEEDRRQGREIFCEDQAASAAIQPVFAMHPGSSDHGHARRWPTERFAQLADTLYHDFGGQLLLLGGPEETERLQHQEIMQLMRSEMPVHSLAGKGSIRATAAILGMADLFIGNDSALMHLAAAMKTPTIGIFGLTNSVMCGPYTGHSTEEYTRVVKLNLPCMPCSYRGHELGLLAGCATRDCLTTLGVDPVAIAARRLLRKRLQLKLESKAAQ